MEMLPEVGVINPKSIWNVVVLPLVTLDAITHRVTVALRDVSSLIMLDWAEHYSEFGKKRIGVHRSTTFIVGIGFVRRQEIRSFPNSL